MPIVLIISLVDIEVISYFACGKARLFLFLIMVLLNPRFCKSEVTSYCLDFML